MSDFQSYQLLAYLTANPTHARSLRGLTDTPHWQATRPRQTRQARWGVWLGWGLIRLGRWLQARSGALDPALTRDLQLAH